MESTAIDTGTGGWRHAFRTLSRRFRQLRLRTLLGAAALAALVTAVALGALLVGTAGSARTVALAAQETHQRVQAYTELIATARDFQSASYSDAHYRNYQTMEEMEFARDRFITALTAAAALPVTNAHERELAEQIATQGNGILAHLAQAQEIVTRVDRMWRLEGQRAAGIEAAKAAQPVRQFEHLLDDEVRRGDEAITAATKRALSLSHSVMLACILCLCLAVASWAIIHGLALRRIAPGLRRLEQGTLAFAAGDLNHRTRLGGHDELAHLSSAFDSMAEMLSEKQKALHQVQVGLERAVRKRTEELQRANEELSASDNRRRAFLADIGHELRTPLTIIRGEAQVALRTLDQGDDVDPREPLERIIQHTHDLSRMVDDLFLIARAEAGGLPMQIRRTDLRELVARIASDFESLAADRGARVSAVAGPPVTADVDPDRLRRALGALVDNALRHTHERVAVTLEARSTPTGATISVSDDGPGIDPALVPDLFQRFRRGHTQAEGSGLGLSLVRALVEAQSGRARLEIRPEGGTHAVIEFPRRPANPLLDRETPIHESAAG